MEKSFAPTAASFRRRLGVIIPVFLVLIISDYFRLDQPLWVFLCEVGALLLLGFGYALLYFRNTRVLADAHSLTYKNAFGLRRSFAGNTIGSVVIADNYQYTGQSGPMFPRLMVLDGDGKAILRWNGQLWSRDEMEQLGTALGIEATVLDGVTTTKVFHQKYPRALSSIEVHPVLWGLGLSLGIIVLIVAAVAIFILLTPGGGTG